ncbi:hypothetical protein CFOL_v3_27236 [Cephalotus follicularis]|uniref:Uncharacterized protein n=1 Tax=Cephalotus follicularis TaxID=3775 RepID=A0A1Q3CUI4_CEPFO|nr:hypothetical protein CFOL_v3_27236 [Cephalotus follicularis]
MASAVPLTLLFFISLFYYSPNVILAAIIIAGVISKGCWRKDHCRILISLGVAKDKSIISSLSKEKKSRHHHRLTTTPPTISFLHQRQLMVSLSSTHSWPRHSKPNSPSRQAVSLYTTSKIQTHGSPTKLRQQ